MKHLATSLIGTVTLCAVAPAAFAAALPDDVRRQVVSYADLDLARPAEDAGHAERDGWVRRGVGRVAAACLAADPCKPLRCGPDERQKRPCFVSQCRVRQLPGS